MKQHLCITNESLRQIEMTAEETGGTRALKGIHLMIPGVRGKLLKQE